MNLEEIFAKLAGLDGGEEITSAIKAELAAKDAEIQKHLNAAADLKKTQTALEAKYAGVLDALGLKDSDSAASEAKELKSSLDAFAASGKKPAEAAKLAERLTAIERELQETKAAKEAETAKRISALKTNGLLQALTKANAVNPGAISRILVDDVTVDDEENLAMKGAAGSVSIEAGVASWLKDNAWAVKVDANGGAGSGGDSGNIDAFLEGFDSI